MLLRLARGSGVEGLSHVGPAPFTPGPRPRAGFWQTAPAGGGAGGPAPPTSDTLRLPYVDDLRRNETNPLFSACAAPAALAVVADHGGDTRGIEAIQRAPDPRARAPGGPRRVGAARPAAVRCRGLAPESSAIDRDTLGRAGNATTQTRLPRRSNGSGERSTAARLPRWRAARPGAGRRRRNAAGRAAAVGRTEIRIFR